LHSFPIITARLKYDQKLLSSIYFNPSKFKPASGEWCENLAVCAHILAAAGCGRPRGFGPSRVRPTCLGVPVRSITSLPFLLEGLASPLIESIIPSCNSINIHSIDDFMYVFVYKPSKLVMILHYDDPKLINLAACLLGPFINN
jgi:hypothetical protein